jgi:hypothetical protein
MLRAFAVGRWSAHHRGMIEGSDSPRNIDIHDRAWLAGFLEGEGFFSCQVRAGYGRIMIGVTSTDRDVVERLARLVPRSRIYGPYTPEPDGLAKRPQ